MRYYLHLLFLTAILFLPVNEISTGSVLEGEEYLAFCKDMPVPEDGIESIYKLIKYPQAALESKVEGKVYVLAFIDETGKVEDVKVIKGIGSGCDEEVVRAVKATKFVPGISNGKNVKVKLPLQIQFKLS